jgi:hypothetical protein
MRYLKEAYPVEAAASEYFEELHEVTPHRLSMFNAEPTNHINLSINRHKYDNYYI